MAMKSKPEGTNEYKNFENALSKVLKVSHAEMQERLQAIKEEKKKPAK